MKNIKPVDEHEMGKLTRSKDWSKTSLGTREKWPQKLHAILDICLASSSTPICIFWGSDLILLYNDAWKKYTGEKLLIGYPAREAFSEKWNKVSPLLKRVMNTGEAQKSTNLQLKLFSRDPLKDFIFTFNPIPGENDRTSGVFAVATEKSAGAGYHLEENEGLFREIINVLPMAVFTTDAKGLLTHYNKEAVKFSVKELELGSDKWYLNWEFYYPDGTRMPHEVCPIAVALKKGRNIQGKEIIIERTDGDRIWFSANASPLRDNEGEIIGGVNMLIDITDRKRAEQIQEEQNHLLEMIASDYPLEDCLSYLCSIVPGLNSTARASIILADEARQVLKYPISPDHRNTFSEGLEGAPINDLAIGTCGEAIYRGRPVTCSNIEEDEKWSEDWRELCLAHGIKACHSAPIFDQKGQAIASFMLCFDEVRKPTEWELRIADFGTDMASVALERDRSHMAILESEERYRTIFESIEEGFCILEKMDTSPGEQNEFRYLITNPAFKRQSGIANVEGKTIREVFPNIEQKWIDTYNEVVKTGHSFHFEEYLSEVDRTLEVRAFPTGNLNQQRVAVLFRNITDRKKIELLLRKNEQRAVFLTNLNDAFRPLYDPIAIQDEATRILAEHLNTSRAGYGEVERDGRVVIQRDYADGVPSIAGFLNLHDHDPDLLKILRTGKTVVVNDIQEDDNITSKQQAAYESIQVRAHVTVPLLKRGRLIAVLGVQQSEVRHWSEEDIAIIEETAERTWSAVEHARAEKRLRKSEKKYRNLFNSIDEGFCILEKVPDREGEPSDFRYIEINPAFEWQSGMPDPVGKTLREILPDIEPEWIENYEYVLETQEPLRFEISFDSPERILNLYTFKTGGRQEKKIAVIFNDVTEQKRAEEALTEEADAMHRLQVLNTQLLAAPNISDALEEVMNAAITLLEADFGTVQVYDTEKKGLVPVATHGFNTKQVELFELITSKSSTPYGRALAEKGRTLLEDVESDPEYKDHRPLAKKLGYRAAQSTPLFGRDGKLIAVLSTHFKQPHRPTERELRILDLYTRQAVDVIERVRAEEKLESINETLEERVEQRTSALLSYQDQLRSLASQLSKAEERERHRLAADLHDNLGQLLAMCKMELDLVEGKIADGSALDQITSLVNEAISYTRELMSDLKPPPSLDQEDIVASVEWVAQKMQKHGLEVSISEDEQPKPLSQEIITALLQSVRESLFNVVKHAQVKKAHIRISRIDGKVLISVQDKGKGFDATKEKLDLNKGGFGLFNIRERMDLLGGKVEIKSTSGEGTTVNLFAPLLVEAGDELSSRKNGPARQAEISYQDSDKIKVLLVDDHKMMLKGLRRIIEQEEDLMVIAEAMNGEDAVNLARENRPDVIVMDVDMPVMNGIDATRKIVSNIENVRIVGLSLHEKGSVAQAMRNAGASAYLSKTEAFEALCATIRSEAVLAKK
ncbi:MAG: GAF domain-containing protein [Balneolaceae bacterium]